MAAAATDLDAAARSAAVLLGREWQKHLPPAAPLPPQA